MADFRKDYPSLCYGIFYFKISTETNPFKLAIRLPPLLLSETPEPTSTNLSNFLAQYQSVGAWHLASWVIRPPKKEQDQCYSWKNTTSVTIYTYLSDKIKSGYTYLDRYVNPRCLMEIGNVSAVVGPEHGLLTVGQRFTFKPCSSVFLLLPSPLPHTWLPPV